MQGRPQLFPASRQISVLVSAEDHKLLSNLVEKARVARPGYSYGDLLRAFIRQGLTQDPEVSKRLRKVSPAQDRIRRLHALARTAEDIAHELQKK